MKKYILLMFICLTMLAFPLYAASAAVSKTDSSYTITLNHVAYRPSHPIVEKDGYVYLSIEDLCSLTYGTYTSSTTNDAATYQMVLQKHRIACTLNSSKAYVDGAQKPLKGTLYLQEDTVYVPLHLLELAEIDYTFDEQTNSFNFKPAVPYSTTTDSYKEHRLLEVSETDLQGLLTPLVTNENISTLYASLKKNQQYVSLLSSYAKQNLLAALQKRLKDFPELEFVFRENDFLSPSPALTKLTTKPFTTKFNGDTLQLQFEDQTLSSSSCYLTFTPLSSKSGIDIDETLHTMIMRILYEYYRDYYNLKDDVNFSPITLTQMDRTNSISYAVYYNAINGSSTHYTLSIYKQLVDGRVRYVIDLVKA